MAGAKTYMSPVGMMMIHNPATVAMGNAEDMKKAIDMLNEVKESIINAYEKKSGISRNKISKLMDEETWFNAKKAVELGFVDEILFDDKDKEEKKEQPKEPEKEEESDTQEDEDDEKKKELQLEAFIFSKKSVSNSFLNKVTNEKNSVGTPVEQLEKRLNLIRP